MKTCWCGIPPYPGARLIAGVIVCRVCTKSYAKARNDNERDNPDPLDGHGHQPNVGHWLRRFWRGLARLVR